MLEPGTQELMSGRSPRREWSATAKARHVTRVAAVPPCAALAQARGMTMRLSLTSDSPDDGIAIAVWIARRDAFHGIGRGRTDVAIQHGLRDLIE